MATILRHSKILAKNNSVRVSLRNAAATPDRSDSFMFGIFDGKINPKECVVIRRVLRKL